MAEYETLLTDLSDRIFTITLNRPDRLNALNEQMMSDIIAALDESDANDDVRVVIFTGAGRGYCAGADLGGGGETFDAGEETSTAGGPPQDGGGRIALRVYADGGIGDAAAADAAARQSVEEGDKLVSDGQPSDTTGELIPVTPPVEDESAG